MAAVLKLSLYVETPTRSVGAYFLEEHSC